MSKPDLPRERIFNSAFKERGRADVVMMDVFRVREGDVLKLTFESVNSPWRQGVWMKTDSLLIVNEQQAPGMQVWQDTAPEEVVIQCRTQDGRLHLYNIWDRGMGTDSQAWSSGMLVEDLPDGRRYCCNDIGFATDFNKLVFRLERLRKKV